jgi:hypothetical protein
MRKRPPRPRYLRPAHRRLALATIALLIPAFAPPTPAVAAPRDDGTGRPGVQQLDKPVPGHALKARPRTPDPATRRQAPPKANWPSAGSAVVDLSTAALAGSPTAAQVRAGTLPVSVGAAQAPAGAARPAPPGKVTVEVIDRAAAQRAGINGLVLKLSRAGTATTPAPVNVTVDYSSFVNAYGGSYGARLHLVRLPGCALSTPDLAQCGHATPLRSHNNTESRTLSADVDAAPATAEATLLAATAGPTSDKGDYKATSLSPSGCPSRSTTRATPRPATTTSAPPPATPATPAPGC